MQKTEVSELRHQLAAAHKSAYELKKMLRDADQKATTTMGELQLRLEEVEEQKLLTEEALKDAKAAAEEAATGYERGLQKYKAKLEKYRRDRDEHAAKVRSLELRQRDNTNSSDLSIEERRDLHAMLRESQTEADRLDRQVREQQEALDELMGVEVSLRKSSTAREARERRTVPAPRSCRRMSKHWRAAKDSMDSTAAAADERSLVHIPQGGLSALDAGDVDAGALIRGAEAAERRHEKEIRGMVLHMEWIKACWDREAMFRSNGMFEKQYLLKEIEIRDAW